MFDFAIPQALVEAVAVISPVVVDGRLYHVTLTGATAELPGDMASAFDLHFRIEERSTDAPFLHLGKQHLDDPAYIAAEIAASVRAIVTGRLAPGTRELL